ncbi:cytochrome P450 [Streptomyces sp. V4I23]|uniref:cytochrome P450 family protein n=1 Tax=Streptomyces sp. V4I23 TaxID=3042282 RepID=UPI00277F79FE|nr:cytochrome P450 [Streptomyces sp. V4I23]MDQ1013117.1 cytochrome P450 [Streptomyces sp. V4I23]
MDSSGSCPLDPAADLAEERRHLNAMRPLVAVELPGGVPAWTATDLPTAQAVLGHDALTKDPAHWPALTDGRVPENWELIALVRGAAMLHQGGAEHRRLRQLVTKAFTRAPTRSKRCALGRGPHRGMLENLAAAGTGEPVDVKEVFARPLPVRVICKVLGVPDAASDALRAHFERLVIPQQDAPADDIRAAFTAIYGTLSTLVEEKRRHPGEDLTSALIAARDVQDRLSEQELVEMIFLLLIAGHETTIHLITSTVHALLTHPEMLAAALQAPDPDAAWAAVVEEGLRYSPPVRHILLRYALDDVEIAGVTVAKGEAVMASVMAVGRDGSRHTNPDSFDTTRSTNREHIAFGHGAHYCLGARLARLEAQIALRALFTRYPHLTLAAEPQRMASISEQGLLSLPVHLHGIKGAAAAAEGRQTAAAASS